MTGTPEEALEHLAGSRAPLLLGVRHHSPAVTSIVARTLAAFEATHVLVELPVEFQPWLPWVGHANAVAPLALAAARGGDPSALAFYPFADFSPELAAIRWAYAHGARVEAIDLPVGASSPEREGSSTPRDGKTLLDVLSAREGGADFEELWDRLVEAHADGQDSESIRRAALLLGWALRVDAVQKGGVSARGRIREQHMRARVLAAAAEPGARVAAVIGSFHASALLSPPLLTSLDEALPMGATSDVTTALLPYSFPLLDSRSGYPAGIRDPAWQQRIVEALLDQRPASGSLIERETFRVVVDVARQIRRSRSVATFPDACEAARVAMDLARLRGNASPSRRELLEGIETSLGQGEALGRGRVIARALSKVLVGDRRGALAEGTPRSGLRPHVDALFRDLGLPTAPEKEAREIVLDPLRSKLDRRRELTFERLAAASVTFAERAARGRTPASIDALTSKWSALWTPATDATLEIAGLYGVTLADAALGSLRAARARALEEDGRAAAADVALLERAARAGLGSLVVDAVDRLAQGLADARFAELVRALDMVLRIRLGHVAGLPTNPEDATPDVPPFTHDLTRGEAAIVEGLLRGLEGLAGSTELADAFALRELAELPSRADLGTARVAAAIDDLAEHGSPLLQGAATALAFLDERLSAGSFAARFASFVDGSDAAGAERAARVRGLLAVGMPALEDAPPFVDALLDTLAAFTDERFFAVLPSLRDGFDVLSPRARDRLLRVLIRALEVEGDVGREVLDLAMDPVLLASIAAADAEASRALEALGLTPTATSSTTTVPASEASTPTRGPFLTQGSLSTRDRIRLVLGRERDALPPHAHRAAVALDRLYGRGEGEGSNDGVGSGTGPAFPSARVWSEEILALFGERVREEVVGRAAERGDGAAALDLDPSRVRPSVELLEQILSLRGGLGEGDVAKLRSLAASIVKQLVDALARGMRPALAGLVSRRTSSRAVGPLDLGRTIQKNLRTARRARDGSLSVTPERLVFRMRQKRALDWHVILVVDVSGSMEPSVIYSALMAAVLSGMPALTVRFIAFNDRVIDLSDHVDDPLTLLLEISVGGGTLIGNALAYARSLVKVPQRTLALVVSDFADGGPIGQLLGEVRALVEGGVRLLGLAALDDRAAPRYEASIASNLAACGMPVAALSPLEVAAWIGEQVR